MAAADITDDIQRSVAPIEVSAQLIATLYKRANALIYANFGALILLTIALWTSADRFWLLTWAIVLSGWTMLRFALAKVYLLKPRPIDETWKWTLMFSVGSGIAGCLWGSSVLLTDALNTGNQGLTTAFVMAALSAAAIAGYSNSLMAFAAFTVPSLSAYGISLIWRDGSFDAMTALFVVFWGSLLWVMARHLNHGFREGLELSLQNAKLAGRLAIERDRANAANQAKTRFMGHMSHELRTPLNAIIGYAGMMSQKVFGPLGNGNYEEYATDIETSGQHLLGMVDRVLQISDLESGNAEMDETPVVLERIVQERLSAYSDDFSARGIETHIDVPDSFPPFRADGDKLTLMMDCLISNAVQHSPDGGLVRISARLWDDEIDIRVSDEGPGLPEAEREKVTEAFHTLDDRDYTQAAEEGYATAESTGTGLGLPLVRLLAELHGGNLRFHNKECGGLAVTIALPVERVVGEKDEDELPEPRAISA